MRENIYDRDFDLGDGGKINVSTNINILFAGYNLSEYQIQQLDQCLQTIKKPKTLDKILKLIKRFPNIPHYEELRVKRILLLGKENDKGYENAARRLYLKHPDYYFSKLHIARVYLYYEKYDEIAALLGDNLLLNKAFPNRAVIHFEEMISFLYYSIDYFLAKGRIKEAQTRCYQLSFMGTSNIQYIKAIKKIEDHLEGLKEQKHRDSILVTSSLEDTLKSFNYSAKVQKLILGLQSEFLNNFKDNTNLLRRMCEAADHYTEVPHLRSMIAEYYIANQDIENALRTVEELMQMFPDFMMTKLLASEIYLKTEDKDLGVQEIFKLFNPELDINKLEVNYKNYTTREFVKFHFLAGRVWVYLKKINLAEDCLSLISRIDSDTPEFNALRKHIDNFYTQNISKVN